LLRLILAVVNERVVVMFSQRAPVSESKSVLLVEDDDRLRGILARYLRLRGHRVIEAISVAEARLAFDHDRVDVLLLDINLAEDTGWNLLRWLNRPVGRDRAGPDPCVVIVAAVPPSATRVAQFQPDAILNKPFPIDAIARLVEFSCRPAVIADGLA
jgi:DNA-binding response OmpR family regulator